MRDLRPVFLVLGVLVTTLGLSMWVPVLVELARGEGGWRGLITSAGLTLFCGISLVLVSWCRVEGLGTQQSFLLTTLVWVVLPAFGALPFTMVGPRLDYTNAFFEAMSGLTTTGSTVITGLDELAHSLLLWRAMLQWLGGIGIIVMAVAILPFLRIGGFQLFRMESSDQSDKVMPRISQIASWIFLFYSLFTLACAFCYWFFGMPGFAAVCHAMTTLATGGFSTSDGSVGIFGNPAIDMTAIAFMIIGSLPFLLYIQAIRGEPQSFLRDPQIRVFFGLLAGLIGAMTIYQMSAVDRDALFALRLAAFNVTSIMTGTGYATADYGDWGGFAVAMFFCITFIGGCAGSTSCGIKIFRFQILFTNLRVQFARIIYPHGVFEPRYGGRAVTDQVSASVLSFFFVFLLSFIVLAIILSLLGLDTLTAFSSAATAIANVGPGLGQIVGPAGSFAPLPDSAKWILSFGMLLGRLEIFTVLALLSPSFWRM